MLRLRASSHTARAVGQARFGKKSPATRGVSNIETKLSGRRVFMGMKTMPHPDHAAETYNAMAPFYDAFTAHHDYELWLSNLLEALGREGLKGPGSMLDLACGTGKSFLPMLDRGWSVTAVDCSKQMLERARAKAPPVRLELADLRSLPKIGQYDLVWCLGDAVNYLLTTDELTLCLDGFRRNLAVDGLGLFDVDALAAYRGFFAETQVVEHADGRLTWTGRTPPDAESGVLAIADLEMCDRDGRVVGVATHRQRHHPRHEIERAVAAAGLELVAHHGHAYDAVLEQPLDEVRHTKAVYIVRRQERR